LLRVVHTWYPSAHPIHPILFAMLPIAVQCLTPFFARLCPFCKVFQKKQPFWSKAQSQLTQFPTSPPALPNINITMSFLMFVFGQNVEHPLGGAGGCFYVGVMPAPIRSPILGFRHLQNPNMHPNMHQSLRHGTQI
jgi:hypothetical protein